MSDLSRQLDQYLAVRRALGFKLQRPGDLLADFVAFLDNEAVDRITVDAALRWATQPADADPSWWGARLAAVRGFARWLSAFDPDAEVPPDDVLPVRSRRAEPYPYTDADIAALMAAASRLRTPLRAATYQTLIGLLAVTGMRVGEVIAMDRGDLDQAEGLLVVRQAKFAKSREVVLHPSTVDALLAYARTRDRARPRPVEPAFFTSLNGTRLIYQNVHEVFHRLVGQIGLRPLSPRCRPRVHDLRHRFAVTTLMGWYRTGDDLAVRIPQLSTYLGHAEPRDTYWYLRAAPELMSIAAQRLEAAQEVVAQGGPR
jgi:integrase